MTLVETAKFISSLSESTAFGHDMIDSICIKTAAYQLIRPIQHLINSSLRQSKFAQKWKFSKLSPRLKSKDCNKMSPSSYRPVAVLSTTSKLIERAAQVQLLEFFESNRLLNQSNHAYRKHLSTSTTLTEILDELHNGTEPEKYHASHDTRPNGGVRLRDA